MVLFVAYNSVQALEATVYAEIGSVAIAVLYVFFVIGNMTAPAFIAILLGSDPKRAMRLGSCTYVLFIAANIYARYWTLLPAAAIVGYAGGVMWVGQSMYISRLARYVANEEYQEERLRSKQQQQQQQHQRQVAASIQDGEAGSRAELESTHAHTVDADVELGAVSARSSGGAEKDIGAEAIEEGSVEEEAVEAPAAQVAAMMGSFMGLSYSFLMSTMVVGNVIAFLVLRKGDDSVSNFDHSDAITLFILYTCIAAVGVAFIATLPSFPGMITMQPPASVATVSSSSDGESGDIHDDDIDDVDGQAGSSGLLASNKSENGTLFASDDDHVMFDEEGLGDTRTSSVGSDPSSSIRRNRKTPKKAIHQQLQKQPSQNNCSLITTKLRGTALLLPMKAMLYALPTFLAWGLALAFAISGFVSHSVTTTIGSSQVPIAAMFYGAADSLTAAMSSRWLTSLANAHTAALAGASIELVPLLFIVFYPSEDWPKADTPSGRGHPLQWIFIIVLSILFGIGDGMLSSAMNTALGLQFPGEYTSSAFAICLGLKAVAICFMFVLNAFSPFTVQLYVVTIGLAVLIVTRIVFRHPLREINEPPSTAQTSSTTNNINSTANSDDNFGALDGADGSRGDDQHQGVRNGRGLRQAET